MSRSLLLLLAFVVLPAQAWAQGTIRGTVTDQDGMPLPGANIAILETTFGAATAPDGTFQIPGVPAGTYEVRARFIGYRGVTRTATVRAGETAVLDFRLEADRLGLDEVVVTALGVERSRQGLTYSVQTVQGAELTEVAAPSMLNALQGKVSGVDITPSSGMPGASAQITIRGSNSLTGNNQPLFVIDGIPVQGGPITIPATGGTLGAGGVSGADGPSRIMDLNPEDIESMTVLKGASAAALYGVRASNGVVLITTRRGGSAAQNRVNVTLSSNLAFDRVSRVPDLQTTFAQGTGGNYAVNNSFSWGPRLTELPETIVNALGQQVPAPRVAFDNVSPFFRTGMTSTNNLDVTGANQFGNFVASLGYTSQEGVIETTGMDRVTARLGGEYRVADWARTGGSISYTRSQVDQIPGGSFLSNPLFTLYWAPRSFDLWGLPFSRADDPQAQINYRGAMDNPRWALARNSFEDDNDRVFGNINVELTPLAGLSVNYRIGSDIFTNRRKQFLDIGSGGTGGRTATPSGGSITETTTFQGETTSLLTATYNTPVFEGLNASFLLGNEINDYTQNLLQSVGNGLAIGGFRNLRNAASISSTELTSRSRNVGVFADLQLDWRSTFFLNVTGRNDWSSTMPQDSRSFFYPGIGAAFVFTELMGVDNRSLVNYGKLKASFAQVGQVAPLYTTTPIFSPGGSTSGFLTNNFQFPFAGLPAFTFGAQIREGVRPQNNTTYEVGTELAFLQERIGLDYTFFHERAIDQIFSVPVSTATGFFTELRNAGELTNTGHELTFRAEPFRVREFSWNLAFNFTAIRSNVVSLAEGVENIFLGGFVEPNIRAQADSPYPIIFGSRFLRDDQGNIIVDGRQTLPNGNPNAFFGMPVPDSELGPIGNVTPNWTGGVINTFRYGDFRLNAQVDIRNGGAMYAGNTRLQKLYGMDAMTEDRETPRVFSGWGSSVIGNLDANGNWVSTGQPNNIEIIQGQTFWATRMDAIDESNVYDTSFIRLRELRVSYSVPTAFLSRYVPQARGVELAVTGRNLFLITDYPNFDPETNLGGASNFQGFEYVNLPSTRNYGFGLRVTL